MDARKQPCKQDCKNRSARCHAECDLYLEWFKAHNAELEKKGLERIAESNYCEHLKARSKRIYKNRRRKNGRL